MIIMIMFIMTKKMLAMMMTKTKHQHCPHPDDVDYVDDDVDYVDDDVDDDGDYVDYVDDGVDDEVDDKNSPSALSSSSAIRISPSCRRSVSVS